MESTARKLKEHRSPQKRERVECQVLPIGQECGEPWPTDEELREILRKEPRASGTVFGPHYAIRFTHKQMAPPPLLLAVGPWDAAQVELHEHNHFALRSMVTSTASLPKQLRLDYGAGGNPPRATVSLLKDRLRVRQGALERQVSSSTDPQESPMKEQMATQGAPVNVTSANLCLHLCQSILHLFEFHLPTPTH